MNRYTQLSTTQFNPLSIEELSIVPMAMRQQHDQASAQLEERRTQLNAFGEFLPHHQERAQALIQQINSAIDNEAEQLNNNGYTRTTGSNIIKLNRDYQNLMSPNGELGKIASAKKAYSENYKQYVEDAQKKGWGLDKIQNGWANHAKNYFGYDEEGNITTIGQAGAPEKYQISDFLKEHASYLGHIKDRVDKMGGGSIGINKYGMLEVRNTSGAVHELNNSPQLQHLNNLMMSTFLTPGSKGYESAMYEGKDLNQLKGEIDSAIGMMFKRERTDTRSQSLSLTKLPGSEGSEGPYGGDFMNTNNSYNFTASKYGDLKSTRKALAELGNDLSEMTEEQRETHEILSNRVREYELALVNNEEYQEAIKYIKNVEKELRNNKSVLNSEIKTDKSGNPVIPKNMQSALGQISLVAQSSKDPKLKEMLQTKERIEAETFSNLPNRVSDYTIARSSNTEANRSIEAADSNIYDLLTNADGAIDNNFKVLKISDDDGKMRNVGNLGDKAKENINSLLNNAKSVRVLSTKRDPLTSKISITLNVATDEKNKASLGFWKGDAGGGKNTTVILEMNTATNNAGVKNILGHLANHYHKYGGDEGKMYASEIMHDSNKRALNNAFAKGNITYSDLDNITPFLDEDTKIQLNHQLKEEASLRYGLPIEILNKMEASEYDEIINNLIRDNKNQTLKLY